MLYEHFPFEIFCTTLFNSNNNNNTYLVSLFIFIHIQVKIWRNVDAETGTIHPGFVNQKALKEKLSKQLKIDLTDGEQLHIQETPVETHENLTEEQLEGMMKKLGGAPCEVQLRQLGMFVAKITLSGGYTVPLKFLVLKR